MKTAEPKLYGFFSPTARERFGSWSYATPSGRSEVEVTFVTPDETGRSYNFPDTVAVGEVGRCLGKIHAGIDEAEGLTR